MKASEDYMKIWKLIETTGIECIKLYQEENKKDPLEREYKARVDFWNRYIEARLREIEFCCDREYYFRLRNNLIEDAKRDLGSIIEMISFRKQFEPVKFIIEIKK